MSRRYDRWKGTLPRPGDRCLLDECYPGWRVKDILSGEEVTVKSFLSKTVRIHRDGDDFTQTVSPDIEVEIVSPKPHSFRPGQVVKALTPSKHAGFVGVIGKSNTMLQVYELNGSGKVHLIAADMAAVLKGRWVIDPS